MKTNRKRLTKEEIKKLREAKEALKNSGKLIKK
jgi:hypothetical protein